MHLPVRSGTNVALLNAIQHELVVSGWVDRAWVDSHTVGYEALERTVREYPPERAAEICGVSAAAIREAARLLGTGERVVSTVLQGVYQSNQATAAAVQVNNVNLLRGMIGKPGCTVFQMNGQPTAQNTRETGANPAVSLPELHRIRSILTQERLFFVVSDAFQSETAELADVVLPAAIWGEKRGTFTNARPRTSPIAQPVRQCTVAERSGAVQRA